MDKEFEIFRNKAFSLIELLISLIIISLLIAAFTPLITKKMKASDITVGSFGGNKNNNDGTTIERNVTRDDCTRLNAVYVSAEDTGNKPICVMKYNVGDGYYNENWEGIQVCKTGASCTISGSTKQDLTPTCWKGTTSSSCNANYGGYSGCNRTVCNWVAAKKLCEGAGWRLPTDVELNGFASTKYSNSTLGIGGLMFCDAYNSGNPLCLYNPKNCSSAVNSGGGCEPRTIWASASNNNSREIVANLSSGVWSSYDMDINCAYSARCVLDTVTETMATTELKSGTDCPMENCQLCSNETCIMCNQGYEKENNKCNIKIANCKTLDSEDKCTECEENFFLLNNKCNKCTPEYGFVKVDGLCVMQHNIGDGYYGELLTGVQFCNSNESCNVSNGTNNSCTTSNLTPTCWNGTTAIECNDSFGGYSGCNRTLCNWTGANKLCNNIGWRLPTSNEMLNIMNKLGPALNEQGLMLCTTGNPTTTARCERYTSACHGSTGDYCEPAGLWTSSLYNANLAYGYGSYSQTPGKNWLSNSNGARCVKGM